MKLPTKILLGLIPVFAMSVASAAAHDAKMGHHKGKDCDMSMMSGEMGKDPVATATKHLAELKAKLKLTPAQQPAWDTFSGQVNEQAKSMAAMHDMKQDKMKDKTQPMTMSAPDKMAMMADMMKERAQGMSKMADNVKTFYATLTPEQKAAFDKMHMSHMSPKAHDHK